MSDWWVVFFLVSCLPCVGYAALSKTAQIGREIIIKAECNRCHDITDVSGRNLGIEPAENDQHCVQCHQQILSTRGNAQAIAQKSKRFPDWERYLNTIVHFTRLPDLGTLTRRVDPRFVRKYLDSPYDLRPHLDESMIPVPLTDAQKDAVVTYLTELNGDMAVDVGRLAHTKTPPVSQVRRTAGRRVFIELGCANCHMVGQAPLAPHLTPSFFKALGAAAQNAPNLAYTQYRIPKPRLIQFIRNPNMIDPKTAMPTVRVSREEAGLIADFILSSSVTHTRPSNKDPQIPILARRVEYEEVHEDIFGKICVHCHMNPSTNGGDGGPGNTGGLGYAGAGLSLETYDGLKRGLKRKGRYQSILPKDGNLNSSVLWRALKRRYLEAHIEAHQPGPEHARFFQHQTASAPGMPMGLAPLSTFQMSLVKTWLIQGGQGPVGD